MTHAWTLGRLVGRRLVIGAALLALWAAWSAGSAHAAGLIWWADEGTTQISYANLDNSGGGANLPTTGATSLTNPSGTTIDAAAGKIYWVAQSETVVSWAFLNGSGGGDLNTTGASVDNPSGIAVDPASGKIYWANEANDTIGFANLNGSGGGNLNTTGATLSSPTGVAVDPSTGKIFWTNYGNGTISFANLDNSGGGGQFVTTGATLVGPAGLVIDQANGKLYWTNYTGSTISFANLNGTGGGGQLPITGATVNHPWGLAIDPGAGKLYWANYMGTSLSFANLDGSGGGNLNTAPITPGDPDFPSLLEPPLGAGAPAISGGTVAGSTLNCSSAAWAPDLLESYLYRVPQFSTYTWTLNGALIGGANSNSITATAPGSYVCQVTGTNRAGSTVQSSTPVTVTPAVKVTTGTIGNQKITVTTPRMCVAASSKLTVTATSTKKASGAKLKFSKVAFYIGKGVKHKRHKGGKVVVTFSPNATKSHVPVTVRLSLAGLKAGTHTLKVKYFYKRTRKKNGHKTTVTVTKTLSVRFSIC